MNPVVFLDNEGLVFELVGETFPHIGEQIIWGHKCAPIGVAIGSQIAAGIVLDPKTTYDVHISVVVLDPAAITRRVLREICNFAFTGNFVRMTALIHPKNKQARKQMQSLGFKQEGCVRKGFDGKSNAIMYGMLKSECPWIKKGINNHGFSTDTA